MSLSRAHGMPLCNALIRSTPTDFFVDEELPFTPDGAGEHLLVQVEKCGQNTAWVGQRLSQFAGIHPRLVSFSGRKDRHAVTRQWFSLQLTARADPDFSLLHEEGIRVLASHRHGRKLRTGTHRQNHFVLVLRDVSADPAAIAARLALIARAGVPDYFGEQRFGRDDGNLSLAQQAVATGRLPSRPEKRGMIISTLRAALFNEILDARVRDGSWNRVLPGEPALLDGTGGRWCRADEDPSLVARCDALDLHPGGLLAGAGVTPVSGEVAALEAAIVARYDGVLDALARWRVEPGRRPLRSRVIDLQHDWLQPGVLRLRFSLWRGSYATAVLRELCDAQDAAAATVIADPDAD